MGTDFSPSFSFNFGESAAPHQAPWEFSDALKQAREVTEGRHGCTIDQKIQQRLQHKKRQQRSQTSGRKRPREAVEAESDEDSGLSSDSDRPLPGELQQDDSEADDVLTDSDVDSADAVSFGTEAQPDLAKDELPKPKGQLEDGTEEAAADEDQGGQSEEDEAVDTDEEVDATDSAGMDTGQAKHTGNRGGQAGTSAAAQQASTFFAQTPDGVRFDAGAFSSLNLSRPLLKACAALGYASPTPIQAACIPLALAGRDICGSAVTGSGKTAAFVLPFLERLLLRDKRVAATYVLILTPTRELAVQVHSMTQKLAQFTDVRVALAVGGLSLSVQAATLRTHPEVVVATPGRLIDHLRNTAAVGLEELQVLVLDEADRLVEMGFSEEVAEVLRLTPRQRQTMLFSATMTEEVQRLAQLSLTRPVRLAADAASAAPKQLLQEVVRLKGQSAGAQKEAVLLSLASRAFSSGRTIVFFRTKQAAHRAKLLFGLVGLPPAAELHGNMTQGARLESLERFRKGEASFLLATDVAARGLDILGVEAVINFDAPAGLPAYQHRIGRTARAGRAGRSVTLVEDADRTLVKEVVKKMRVQLQNRIVQPVVVQQWASRIERLEEDIQGILQEEREETALRKAEMEAHKAENLIEHEAEIHARPARTWFQSEKQKRELDRAARELKLGKEGGGKGKKSKEAAANERKLRREAEAAERKKKQRDALLEETGAQAGRVRAIKSREAQLREQGMLSRRAGKLAAAELSGYGKQSSKQKARAKKKPRLGGDGPDGGGGGLFDGDGTGREPSSGGGGPARVYAGGGRSERVTGKPTRSTAEAKRAKRGGKGAHSFKSKARHKRR